MKIDTASSGKEMLEKIRKKHYDVIFLDHRMPEMSGVEAFHAMQDMTDCLCKDVPVVALTANVVSGAKEYYMKEGFTAYLSKPIDSKELEHLLTELLPPEKTTSNFADDNNEQTAESPEDQFSNLKGISLHTAMQNCGSPDVFMVAVREYYTNIKKRADDIERFARTKDFKNYTIQVHALKSSSRLIGALELSEQAAYLEKCGTSRTRLKSTRRLPTCSPCTDPTSTSFPRLRIRRTMTPVKNRFQWSVTWKPLPQSRNSPDHLTLTQ